MQLLEKYKREKTGSNLRVMLSLIWTIKQLTTAGQYPHFVSEGHFTQKNSRIQNCTYLKGCYDALKSESGNLVTYGVSFKNDHHILNAIKESGVRCCYVGIHSNDSDTSLHDKAKSLMTDSRKVKVYNTETAKVWQGN